MKIIYLLLGTFVFGLFTQPEIKHSETTNSEIRMSSKNHAPAYIHIHSAEENDQDGKAITPQYIAPIFP